MKMTTIRHELNSNKTVFRTLQFTIIGFLLLALGGCGMLDDLVEEKIETVGSNLTGVEVNVAETNLRLAGGMGEITGLTVANPEGYLADYAMEMDLLRLNLGVASTLGGEPILLEELVIDAPRVNFEQKEPGVSNLKQLADNSHANREETEKRDDESSGEPVRIIIRRLRIHGVQYSILLADGSSHSGILPTIELSEVGTPDGKSPAGLGMVVLLSMGREMFLELAAEKLKERVADLDIDLKVLDIDHVMHTVEQSLELSRAQLAYLRPVLQEKIQALRQAVQDVKRRGFLNLHSLPDKFTLIAAQAREELKDQLTPEQLDQIESLFMQLQQTSKEEIIDALSSRLAHFLELHEGQIEAARTILQEEIEERSRLLASLVQDPLLPPADFMEKLETIQAKSRSRLEPLLDSEAMERLTEQQEQLRTLLEEAYFGIAAPLIEKLIEDKV